MTGLLTFFIIEKVTQFNGNGPLFYTEQLNLYEILRNLLFLNTLRSQIKTAVQNFINFQKGCFSTLKELVYINKCVILQGLKLYNRYTFQFID